MDNQRRIRRAQKVQNDYEKSLQSKKVTSFLSNVLTGFISLLFGVFIGAFIVYTPP